MASEEISVEAEVVEITFEELLDENSNLSAKIESAFGPNGNGIVSVSHIPNLLEYRKSLLLLSHKFANLPQEAKRKVEDPENLFSNGWSHGKEKLEDGRTDLLKGSFYANPIFDQPAIDETTVQLYPAYCQPNLWPKEDLPELEYAFKNLGQLIVDVGLRLTSHIDKYVTSRNPSATPGKLLNTLKNSRCFKGRLLHYFPVESQRAAEDVSSWCGWHKDHGSLTGLTKALYTNSEGVEVESPDPNSGLYIRNREGKLIKVIFPPSSLSFQMGETMQIHSGGMVVATPHCVKAALREGLSRNTFALFMQPNWDEPIDLPPGVSQNEVGVERWEPGMDFGKFSKKTFAKYYG